MTLHIRISEDGQKLRNVHLSSIDEVFSAPVPDGHNVYRVQTKDTEGSGGQLSTYVFHDPSDPVTKLAHLALGAVVMADDPRDDTDRLVEFRNDLEMRRIGEEVWQMVHDRYWGDTSTESEGALAVLTALDQIINSDHH